MEPKRYVWKTASVIRETNEAVTIAFDTNADYINYRAGQFLNVHFMLNGEAVSRSYSFSSSPGGDEKPSITVKKMEGGVVSQYIYYHAEEIKEWIIDAPHGFFFVSDEIMLSEHVVLIAGGSGISPIFSIIKYLLKHSVSKVSLIYSSKDWERTIYRSVLLHLEHAFSERFHAYFVFTKEEGAKGFPKKDYLQGRLSRVILKKLLKKLVGYNTSPVHYFVCGPNGLIKTVEETLTGLAIAKSFIHKEYFAEPKDLGKAVVLPDTKLNVLLHYYEQTNLLEITPGKTILQAALEDRIQVPYSCKSGTCGICAARQTAGQVYMQNNFALAEEQIQRGMILLCQSYPLDDQVTVEITGM